MVRTISSNRIESRLAPLRDAISVPSLRVTLIDLAEGHGGMRDEPAEALLERLARERDEGIGERAVEAVETANPDLSRILGSVQLAAGPDVTALFIYQYARREVVAVAAPYGLQGWSGGGPLGSDREDINRRISAVRRALSGSIPDAVVGCTKILRSAAQISLGSYDLVDALSPLYVSQPYVSSPGEPAIALVQYHMPCRPYALAMEVSLRRASEWMAVALAPGDDAYLIDEQRRLLARARRGETIELRAGSQYWFADAPLSELSATELGAATLPSEDAFIREGDDPLGGGPGLAATAWVGATGWRVIVLRPASQSPLEASLGQLLVLGALAAALVIAASTVALALRRPRASGAAA